MRWTDWFKGLRVQTFQLGVDDIAVFVVGPTGSGKSFFVKQVTECDLVKPSKNLDPSTTKVQAIRCELTDEAKQALGVGVQKYIVFVDTPSFCTQDPRRDNAAEKEMKSWLNKSKSKSILVGTIYMHRIESDPCLEPTIRQHLRTFALSFPQGFVYPSKRLHAVLSYHEGIVPDDTIEARKKTFETQLSELPTSMGGWVTSSHADLLRGDDSETAWEVVVALFAKVKPK